MPTSWNGGGDDERSRGLRGNLPTLRATVWAATFTSISGSSGAP